MYTWHYAAKEIGDFLRESQHKIVVVLFGSLVRKGLSHHDIDAQLFIDDRVDIGTVHRYERTLWSRPGFGVCDACFAYYREPLSGSWRSTNPVLDDYLQRIGPRSAGLGVDDLIEAYAMGDHVCFHKSA